MVLSGRGVPPVTIVDLDKGLYNILRKVLGAVRPGLSAGGTARQAGGGYRWYYTPFCFVSGNTDPFTGPAGPYVNQPTHTMMH